MASPCRGGSARELEDLVKGCPTHHKQLDDGTIKHVGWTKDRRPIFETKDGERLEPKRRGPRGPPR